MPSLPTVAEMLTGLRAGSRVMLGRAITLVESTRLEHRQLAQELIDACLPYTGGSFRIGITGVPGVGKSTLIESLGLHILNQDPGHKLAVLAIDPSSSVTHGSILGDKTRMELLSRHDGSFIRPSPAGSTLGGAARRTFETILLCETAGFNHVIVETVGVGQSETAVHSLTDCFLLLLLPGAGDELQGMKRGIVEMADIIAINKSDGDNTARATQTERDYRASLHLFPSRENGWVPEVLRCAAISGDGIPELWERLLYFNTFHRQSGWLVKNRLDQERSRFHQALSESILETVTGQGDIRQRIRELEADVSAHKLSPFTAAGLVCDLIFNSKEKG